MQFWILAKTLQPFLFAAISHSVALEGHRETVDIVGIDSAHFIDEDVYKLEKNEVKNTTFSKYKAKMNTKS